MVDFSKPLSELHAARLVREILQSGTVGFTKHARERMVENDLHETDVVNVLRHGLIYEPAEMENGSWRYRLHTDRICVVVAFRSESGLVVVTTWRKMQRGRR